MVRVLLEESIFIGEGETVGMDVDVMLVDVGIDDETIGMDVDVVLVDVGIGDDVVGEMVTIEIKNTYVQYN